VMNIPVAVVILAVSLAAPTSASFASLCQLDLKAANVDLNSFFPSLVGTKALSILRYSGNWTGNGASDTCAILLDGCENCGCTIQETALLIKALGWTVQCEVLPANVVSIQQRSIDSPDTEEKEEEEPLHPDDHELFGADPSTDTTQALLSEAMGSAKSSNLYAVPVPRMTRTADHSGDDSNDASNKDRDHDDNSSENALLQQRINEYMEPYGDDSNDQQSRPVAKSMSDDSSTGKTPAADTSTTDTTVTGAPVTDAPVKDSSDDGASAKDSSKDDAPVTVKDDTDSNAPVTDSSKSKELPKSPEDKSDDPDSSTEKEFFELNADSKKKVADTKSSDGKDDEDSAPLSEFMAVFGQMTSWRSRYFVVLGFFIVFTIIFIIVIVILYLKLKAARKNGKPLSPGPGSDELRTPMVNNEHSFQFSDDALPR